MAVIRVCMGLPWYAGADQDCCASFLEFYHYLGRLKERLDCIAVGGIWPNTKLDPEDDIGDAEVYPDLEGTQFEFGTANEIGLSLPGMARERIVDRALAWGADYIFWSDDDMLFKPSIFLQLYRNQVDICAALAFTARDPISPVVYKFNEVRDEANRLGAHISILHDYKRDELQQVDAIGSGVMLTKADVFRKIDKPWFNSTGMGEDIHFCLRAHQAGIPVHVDTRIKVGHLKRYRNVHDEPAYLKEVERQRGICVQA